MWISPKLDNIIVSVKYATLIVLTVVFYKTAKVISFTIWLRKHYADLPCLPRHWLWGNLVNCGQRLQPSLNRHPDYGWEEIWIELGRPQCFMADLAPVEGGYLVVAHPDIAEQIVQPTKEYVYSCPKIKAFSNFEPVIGKHSIITAEGEEWKKLRKRFNRGFQPSHLHSLSPLIVEKTRVFVSRLEAAATSDATFSLQQYAQDLVTDIITQLTIEEDFRSQSIPDGQGPKSPIGLLTASRIISGLTWQEGQGFSLSRYLNPVRPLKQFFYDNLFTFRVRKVLARKLYAQSTQPSSSSLTPGKAIVQLALAGMTPTPALIENTVSQIKSFLFAGQDTTATSIQWICYEMSKAAHSTHHAAILANLKAEHTRVLGSSSAYSALDILSLPTTNSESLLNNQLPYTTAFVKEILRVHSPAATARVVPRAGTRIHDNLVAPPYYIRLQQDDGGGGTKQVRIDGLSIYSPHFLIHRNPLVWGPDAHVFNPDRWLDESYMRTLPLGAWRPFERGPRNCIGQELALMELKVVVCAVARAFVFRKIGLTGRNGEREVWNINRITTQPCDGMIMKVRTVRASDDEKVMMGGSGAHVGMKS